jgi:hypothetical protein
MSTILRLGPTIPKTASFTLDPTTVKAGTVFTNAGAAGAVTCTLPNLNLSRDGYWVEFRGVADQNIAFAAAANKAITLNNAAATSLTLQTGGQKIGGVLRAIWDGNQSKWHLNVMSVGFAGTVA